MIKLFHGSNVKIEVPDLVHSISVLFWNKTCIAAVKKDMTHYQSAGYVYSFLLNELKKGRVA